MMFRTATLTTLSAPCLLSVCPYRVIYYVALFCLLLFAFTQVDDVRRSRLWFGVRNVVCCGLSRGNNREAKERLNV